MSDVERFYMAEWSEDAGFGAMDHFVYARDYDTAQVELAALREDLAMLHDQHAEQSCIFCNNSGELLSEVKALRTSLTAAEQRIANLCGLLVRTLPVVRMIGRPDHIFDYAMAGNIRMEIETTLNPQPTESGASE